MAQFKANELARSEAEAKAQYQRDLDMMRMKFEEEVETRKAKLAELEAQVDEQVQRKRREYENENFKERQHLLREQEALKMRQDSHEKEMELSRKAVQLEEERLRRAIELANERLREADRKHEQFNHRLKEELQRYQTDFDREHAQLLISLKTEKAKLDAKIDLYESRGRELDVTLEKLSAVEKELEQTKDMLHKTTTDNSTLRKERDILRQSFNELKASHNTVQQDSKLSLSQLQIESVANKK